MAATTTAPDLGLCDDDIVRYWTIFIGDTGEDAYDAAFAIAVTPQVSCEQARAALAALAERPHHQRSATRTWLSRAVIDDEAFTSALHSTSKATRLAALSNPHRAAAIQRLWPTLSDHERTTVIRENHGLDSDFIEAHCFELPRPAAAATNRATPRRVLERLVDGDPLGCATDPAYSVVSHPNADRSWVDLALAAGGRVAAAAAQWPGFTREELEALARSPDADVVDAARSQLERWFTPAVERRVQRLSGETLHVDVALHLRCLTGDATAAARRLVASGFDGTVAELCDVATTFQ